MEVINQTPFTPFVFEFRDQDGDDHFIVIVRGTFKIVNGQPLKPLQEQEPIVTADEYLQEPLTSPLQRESDLCPVKLNTDVFVVGDAVAPEGGARQWKVAVQVGPKKTELNVYGPREWQRRSILGWKLSEPELVGTVPLDYAHCYGGTVKDVDGSDDSFPQNPIGIGYSNAFSRRHESAIPAPQIESVDDPVTNIETRYEPKCFAPVPKAWPQRLQLAGTYDDDWLEKKWPEMPDDFDAQFFNAALPELQLEQDLKGGEKIRLEGFHKHGPVEFSIPDYKLLAEISDEFSTAKIGCSLDTVEIDTKSGQVGLVWRASDIKLEPVQKVKITMTGTGVIHRAG